MSENMRDNVPFTLDRVYHPLDLITYMYFELVSRQDVPYTDKQMLQEKIEKLFHLELPLDPED